MQDFLESDDASHTYVDRVGVGLQKLEPAIKELEATQSKWVRTRGWHTAKVREMRAAAERHGVDLPAGKEERIKALCDAGLYYLLDTGDFARTAEEVAGQGESSEEASLG
mgnify:CR=1 FL=1